MGQCRHGTSGRRSVPERKIRSRPNWRRNGQQGKSNQDLTNKITLHVNGDIDYYDGGVLFMRQKQIPRRVFVYMHKEVQQRILEFMESKGKDTRYLQ